MGICWLKNSIKLDNNFEKRSEPVLIKGFLRDCGIPKKINFELIKKKYGSKKVKVAYSKNGIYKLNPNSGELSSEVLNMRLGKFLNKINEEDNGVYYLQQALLEQLFPMIFHELELDSVISLPSYYPPTIWIGQKGTIVQLHFDWPNNFYFQVEGQKRFILYSPEQTKYLYPNTNKTKISHVSQVDIHNPDLKKFPKFARAESITFDLDGGDVLYIPPFWWHQVQGGSRNISISVCWPIKLVQIPPSIPTWLQKACGCLEEFS